MSVGANHGIRCLGISPDLSLIDCAFIRLAQQRYHFKLGNEPNAKRRFNRYYSKDMTYTARHLDVGFCIYVLGEKLQVVKIPLFHTKRLPMPYVEPQEPIPQKKSIIRRILSAIGRNKETEAYNYEEEYQREQEQNEEDVDFLEEW